MDFFKVHSSSFSISAIDSIVFKTAMLAYLQAGHDQFIVHDLPPEGAGTGDTMSTADISFNRAQASFTQDPMLD